MACTKRKITKESPILASLYSGDLGLKYLIIHMLSYVTLKEALLWLSDCL